VDGRPVDEMGLMDVDFDLVVLRMLECALSAVAPVGGRDGPASGDVRGLAARAALQGLRASTHNDAIDPGDAFSPLVDDDHGEVTLRHLSAGTLSYR